LKKKKAPTDKERVFKDDDNDDDDDNIGNVNDNDNDNDDDEDDNNEDNNTKKVKKSCPPSSAKKKNPKRTLTAREYAKLRRKAAALDRHAKTYSEKVASFLKELEDC